MHPQQESAVLKGHVASALHQLAQELAQGNGERLRRFLDFAARFHRYSPGNQFLIARQCPEATYVAGYDRWRRMGYQVARGQKGIRILAPMPFKRRRPDGEEEVGLRFKAVAVFDASQLTGDQPLPRFYEPLADDEQERCDRVERALAAEGIAVAAERLAGDIQGRFQTQSRRIVVRAGLDSHSRLLVLFHEWAHAVLHPKGYEGERARKEWQAEATSYVVASHFGVHHPFAADYLASWRATPEELERQLTEVMAAATHIIGALTNSGDQADDGAEEPVAADNLGTPHGDTPPDEDRVVIVATMADGTTITETVAGFDAFARMVLSFRRDPDVASVRWHALKEEEAAAA